MAAALTSAEPNPAPVFSPVVAERLKGNDPAKVTDLDFYGSSIKDADLASLKSLTQLQALILNGTEVGDAGLEHRKSVTSLRRLFLSDTQVGEAGLAHLKTLTQLVVLNFNFTQVSDPGMEHLTRKMHTVSFETSSAAGAMGNTGEATSVGA